MLSNRIKDELSHTLGRVNAELRSVSGATGVRQPVHSVYGGAHLFKSTTPQRLGEIALKTLHQYAPDARTFSQALGYSGTAQAQESLYQQVQRKLSTEPVEDYRIDFEDGYGHRADLEEDATAKIAAAELAQATQSQTVPYCIGIRIKPFTEELKARGLRTLDLFLTELIVRTSGNLPANFVVTLPKVTHPEQIHCLVKALEHIERTADLERGSLKLEFMVETPQSILNQDGHCPLLSFVQASEGRCLAAHFGAYDYTAGCDVIAQFQSLDHPSCDFARQMMKIALSGTGVWLSDGAVSVLPVGPHRSQPELSESQKNENKAAVHRGWRLAYEKVCASIRQGFYQGWDLHPNQLPARYGACYASLRQGLPEATARLKNFVDRCSRASRVGETFDDAATAQGLLNFFLRAMNCGAITESEVNETGLSLAELRTKSFSAMMRKRRATENP